MRFPTTNTAPVADDSPNVGFAPTPDTDPIANINRMFRATMWLMYQPTARDGQNLSATSIPVPLKKLNYRSDLNCALTRQPNGTYTGSFVTPPVEQLESVLDTLEFPTWSAVYQNR